MAIHAPEFYEREYSGGRARIPDYDSYFTRWAEDSAVVRAELAAHLDLEYGPGPKETLDLFPSGQKDAPLLIFIHGGYWRSMDKRDFDWIARSFVRAGINVAVPNYAPCPAVTIADITESCRRALVWLYHHAVDYEVSARRLIVTGHSAGGHLTGMMFATDWNTYGMPSDTIGGGVSLSGLFDLEPLRYTSMNADWRLDETSARASSPAFFQPRVKAKMVTAVGALESSEFLRQSQIIAAAWPDVSHPALHVKDCHHFNILDAFTDLKGEIWQAAAGMLYG